MNFILIGVGIFLGCLAGFWTGFSWARYLCPVGCSTTWIMDKLRADLNSESGRLREAMERARRLAAAEKCVEACEVLWDAMQAR